MAGGDPRAARLLAWSSGSTYGLGFDRATILAIVAVTALPILPALARWLNLFPLGPITTKSMGVDLSVSRGSMLLFAAILTAAATLLVGPLSFAGLIAPHLARLAGFRHALSPVSYTHPRAHETGRNLVCRPLLEKKKIRTNA